ncbi:hypothetical protein CIB48_g11755, partial [Xylaria polymorpha]
MSAPDPFDSAL